MFRLFAPKSAEDNEVCGQVGFGISSETPFSSPFPFLFEVQALQLTKRDHNPCSLANSLQAEKCDATCYVYQNPFGGRDVFALGSIIVMSYHQGTRDTGSESSRDYSIADKNEIAAIELAPSTIPVPRFYFSGKLKGKDVVIQERIPGVALNGAWPYLSPI